MDLQPSETGPERLVICPEDTSREWFDTDWQPHMGPFVEYVRGDVAFAAVNAARANGMRFAINDALRLAEATASTKANMSKAWRDGAAEVVRRLRELAAEMGAQHEAG